MDTTNVAIIGLGTIGTGVARLLVDSHDRVARHAGRQLVLKHVVDRDLTTPRDVELPAGVLTDDLTKVTDDPEIKVVAQLIGGTHIYQYLCGLFFDKLTVNTTDHGLFLTRRPRLNCLAPAILARLCWVLM